MTQKKANHDIRCRVSSCVFHCGDCDCCSLKSIQVEPCANCGDGFPAGETMCASYSNK